MPWQHYVLIAELIVSAVIAARFIRVDKRDTYALPARVGYPWAVVEAGMVGLLIWGADHFAWQYAVVGVWYVTDCLFNVIMIDRPVDMVQKRKKPGVRALGTAVLIVALFALLYTGA